MDENELSNIIIGAAITVHREMGPGLMESVYEHCMEHELQGSGIQVERQVALPVYYKGTKLDLGFRIDLWVERKVILELKATDALHTIHTAKLLNYLKLTDNRLGLLINFNMKLLRSGIKRVANGL